MLNFVYFLLTRGTFSFLGVMVPTCLSRPCTALECLIEVYWVEGCGSYRFQARHTDVLTGIFLVTDRCMLGDWSGEARFVWEGDLV